MTDGLSLPTTGRPTQTRMDCLCMEVDCAICYQVIVPPQTNRETLTIIEQTEPDLYNFSAWIECQSMTTIAAILDLAANELYRRRDWPSIAGKVKDAARDLRAAAREVKGLNG